MKQLRNSKQSKNKASYASRWLVRFISFAYSNFIFTVIISNINLHQNKSNCFRNKEFSYGIVHGATVCATYSCCAGVINAYIFAFSTLRHCLEPAHYSVIIIVVMAVSCFWTWILLWCLHRWANYTNLDLCVTFGHLNAATLHQSRILLRQGLPQGVASALSHKALRTAQEIGIRADCPTYRPRALSQDQQNPFGSWSLWEGPRPGLMNWRSAAEGR